MVRSLLRQHSAVSWLRHHLCRSFLFSTRLPYFAVAQVTPEWQSFIDLLRATNIDCRDTINIHDRRNTTQRMAQPPRVSMLKLSLPGVDPAVIPLLTAKQVAQIPAEFLAFLHSFGRVEDYGDLKIISTQDDRHNFTILSIAEWVSNGRLEHGELMVERLETMGLGIAHEPVTYDQNMHQQDLEFVSTRETHARFLQRLGLYMFSDQAGMWNLKDYICKTICTQFPIYEAEVIALLTSIFASADDLRRFDTNLASFISERMLYLRNILATNTVVLPLLCKAIGAKDRFLALAGRADHSVLALALAELRRGIGEVEETDAMLETFIEQHGINHDTNQVAQPAPLITPTTQAKRKRGRPSKAEAEAKQARLDAAPTTSTVVWKEPAITRAFTTQDSPAALLSAPGSNDAHAANENVPGGLDLFHAHQSVQRDGEDPKNSAQSITDTAADDELVHTDSSAGFRERRPHPGQSLLVTRQLGGPRGVRMVRPQVEDEYWSVPPDKWATFTDQKKRAYTHAGNIYETAAGMISPEPCSACRELGHSCDVYTAHPLQKNFGNSCAKCRISTVKCSHAGGKKYVDDI